LVSAQKCLLLKLRNLDTISEDPVSKNFVSNKSKEFRKGQLGRAERIYQMSRVQKAHQNVFSK
jgi:hypothetical protein